MPAFMALSVQEQQLQQQQQQQASDEANRAALRRMDAALEVLRKNRARGSSISASRPG